LTGLFLTEAVPRGLPAVETAERIRGQGGLVSIPHPFDMFRRNVISREALPAVIEVADIIEGFNARNTFSSANARAKGLATSVGLPVTAVTDAHTAIEVGRSYTELQLDEVSAGGLLAALASAQLIEHPITPFIHLLTTVTKMHKRLF
jgi:hypothetical protein